MKEKVQSDNPNRLLLYEYLSKLSKIQFKQFYCLFVHYWANYKCFISKQYFFNLWCELNQLCYESDESFPEQYDNFEAMRSFWLRYPYYFIEKLPIQFIAHLFVQYIDDYLDALLHTVKELYEKDIRAAYTYVNSALGLDESIDTLVIETQDHVKYFS